MRTIRVQHAVAGLDGVTVCDEWELSRWEIDKPPGASVFVTFPGVGVYELNLNTGWGMTRDTERLRIHPDDLDWFRGEAAALGCNIAPTDKYARVRRDLRRHLMGKETGRQKSDRREFERRVARLPGID